MQIGPAKFLSTNILSSGSLNLVKHKQKNRRLVTQVNVFNRIKFTVQFETEGNGQNEIFSHMDRSEVKLENSEKNIVISHTQNEILKQKNLTGSRFDGAPKL